MKTIKIFFISIGKAFKKYRQFSKVYNKFTKIFLNPKDEVRIIVKIKKWTFGISIFNYESIRKIETEEDAQKWVMDYIYKKLRKINE
jgi:hypothetical protein